MKCGLRNWFGTRESGTFEAAAAEAAEAAESHFAVDAAAAAAAAAGCNNKCRLGDDAIGGGAVSAAGQKRKGYCWSVGWGRATQNEIMSRSWIP